MPSLRRLRPTLALALLIAACGGEPEPFDPSPVGAALPDVVAALRAGDAELALQRLAERRARGDLPEGAGHFEAVALVDAGRMSEAAEVLAVELADHPGNALGHLLLAEALIELGRADEAVGSLDRARALGVRSPYLELVTARGALAREDDIAAARAFLAYLQSDRTSPRAAEAHYGLAQIAQRQGNPEAAAEAQTLSETIETAHQYLAAFQARLAEDPRDADAALGAGMAWLDLYRDVDADPGLLAQSEAAFRACLQLDPGEVRALYNLGLIRLMAGDGDQALTLWRTGLTQDPDHVGMLLNCGVLTLDRGDAAAALALLERARGLATDRDDRVRADLELARTHQALGDPAAAAALIEDARRIAPDHPRLQELAPAGG